MLWEKGLGSLGLGECVVNVSPVALSQECSDEGVSVASTQLAPWGSGMVPGTTAGMNNEWWEKTMAWASAVS